MLNFNKIIEQLKHFLGDNIIIKSVNLDLKRKMPLYLAGGFSFQIIEIEQRQILLAQLISDPNDTTPSQLKKHQNQLEVLFQMPVVFLIEELKAYLRKRLIEKNISFIVPGKQLYIPSLLIHLNEVQRISAPVKRKMLSPAAQCLLLYHLQIENLDAISFKLIAEKINYSTMTVTRIVKELAYFALCEIEGTKEKKIKLSTHKKDIWLKALPLFTTPIKKVFFADKVPLLLNPLYSGETAMEYYTNLNNSFEKVVAIDSQIFSLLKKEKIIDFNPYEGMYRFEVWSYNPKLLSKGKYVDVLSLYLSLRNEQDDRIQIELDNLINTVIW